MNILSAAERIEQKFGGKWEKAGGEIMKPPASISTGSLLMDEIKFGFIIGGGFTIPPETY